MGYVFLQNAGTKLVIQSDLVVLCHIGRSSVLNAKQGGAVTSRCSVFAGSVLNDSLQRASAESVGMGQHPLYRTVYSFLDLESLQGPFILQMSGVL